MAQWKIRGAHREIGFVVVTGMALVAATAALANWLNVTAGIAAWVQAIGSIVAVAAAYAISRSGVAAAERVRREERLQLLRGAEATVSWSAQVLTTFADKAHPSITYDAFERLYRPADFQAALRAIHSIPLSQIADLDLVRDILRLEAVLIDAADRLAKVERGSLAADAKPRGLPDLSAIGVEAMNAKESFRLRVVEIVTGRPQRAAGDAMPIWPPR